jgi:hypothetical protein
MAPRSGDESGKTLNDFGPTGAIIRDRDHICAPPTPGSSLGLTEDKVDAEGVLQLHLEHLTASWARNDGSA